MLYCDIFHVNTIVEPAHFVNLMLHLCVWALFNNIVKS